MTETRLLIIFVKNLEKGRVKTRLAKTVGDDKALDVYKELTDYTRSVAATSDADKQVWYSGFIPEEDAWNVRDFTKKLQAGDDLGARMKESFRRAFKSGYERVIIIGSDCAQLTSGLLDEAYAALANNNVVIGPSQDGGYYLLGMDALYGQLFEDILWSTREVLPRTLAIAKDLELEVSLLPELNDVDNEEDWLAVKDRL